MKNGDLIEHAGGDLNRHAFRDRGAYSVCGIGDRRCRVIVSKERLEEQWPSDETFRAFAAKLADAVQRALGEGRKVAPQALGGECCPLGCVVAGPFGGIPYPGVGYAPLEERNSWFDFIVGFDGGDVLDADNPYYRLGQAYRRRFTPASAS